MIRIKSILSDILTVVFSPFNFCLETINSITYFAATRPSSAAFACSLFTVSYFVLSSRKVRDAFLSLPYDKILNNFKSRRMIVFYATLAEVFCELIMALVLAGVSVLITTWLLFEEVAERRSQNRGATLRKQHNSQESMTGDHNNPKTIHRRDAKIVHNATKMKYSDKDFL